MIFAQEFDPDRLANKFKDFVARVAKAHCQRTEGPVVRKPNQNPRFPVGSFVIERGTGDFFESDGGVDYIGLIIEASLYEDDFEAYDILWLYTEPYHKGAETELGLEQEVGTLFLEKWDPK